MNNQIEDALQAKQAGIDLSSANQGEEWRRQAIRFVGHYLTNHRTLFVDDLWDAGLPEAVSGRALGAVLQHAARQGWMSRMMHGGYQLAKPSVRSHMSLKPVWRSEIFGQMIVEDTK